MSNKVSQKATKNILGQRKTSEIQQALICKVKNNKKIDYPV